MSGGATTGDRQPEASGEIFRPEAMAARGTRRPGAALELAGAGLSLSFWGLIALTAAGMVAVATIRIPRTLVGLRVEDGPSAASGPRAEDRAPRCRTDRGEVAVEFAPHLVTMVPRRGVVELVTPTGSTSVAVRAPSGTDPGLRCLQLGPDRGQDAIGPTVQVTVLGGTGLDFVFGRGR